MPSPLAIRRSVACAATGVSTDTDLMPPIRPGGTGGGGDLRGRTDTRWVSAPVAAAEDTSKFVTIKSPIIGTLYRKPSPDKPVFVEVGSTISKGDVVCVIEAMKLFNEIESEVSGKIVKVLVDDASPVEFDQPLFLVDPS